MHKSINVLTRRNCFKGRHFTFGYYLISYECCACLKSNIIKQNNFGVYQHLFPFSYSKQNKVFSRLIEDQCKFPATALFSKDISAELIHIRYTKRTGIINLSAHNHRTGSKMLPLPGRYFRQGSPRALMTDKTCCLVVIMETQSHHIK